MSVQNITSAPDYIHKFLESNIDQLNKIYSEEKNNQGDGILYCKCSMNDNKLELIYMNKKLFTDLYNEDLWNSIQTDKKSIFFQDLDINENFVLYF